MIYGGKGRWGKGWVSVVWGWVMDRSVALVEWSFDAVIKGKYPRRSKRSLSLWLVMYRAPEPTYSCSSKLQLDCKSLHSSSAPWELWQVQSDHAIG